MMIRILFIWAVRHPASAYVQGINDLCAPLLLVFISEYVMQADSEEDQLFSNNKNIKQVSRLIKNNLHDKLDGNESKSSDQDEEDIFSAEKLHKLLKSKNRSTIYDVLEDDFLRIKKLRAANSDQKREDMDEYMEEIGDVDPSKITKIN